MKNITIAIFICIIMSFSVTAAYFEDSYSDNDDPQDNFNDDPSPENFNNLR